MQEIKKEISTLLLVLNVKAEKKEEKFPKKGNESKSTQLWALTKNRLENRLQCKTST